MKKKYLSEKTVYDATANGFFGKLGGYYMLSMDTENPDNGFMQEKMAASFYNQEYKKVPIRGFGGSDQYLAFHQ